MYCLISGVHTVTIHPISEKLVNLNMSSNIEIFELSANISSYSPIYGFTSNCIRTN